ncbi:hypothetical protein [Natronococcus roseus]|uniref:hypothetical protein n=1 Tax=Natronococcus roseus TaxID=1052014 RepID=UPI00374CD082
MTGIGTAEEGDNVVLEFNGKTGAGDLELTGKVEDVDGDVLVVEFAGSDLPGFWTENYGSRIKVKEWGDDDVLAKLYYEYRDIWVDLRKVDEIEELEDVRVSR